MDVNGTAAPGSVWHLVPAQGAGVDRHVRDVCALRPADRIVHVSDVQCVLETPSRDGFVALDAGAVADLAFAGTLGRPRALHAHSTTPAVRHAAELLRAATGAPLVVTLHDVWFTEGPLEPFEREQRLRFARGAQARLAPSRFIVDLAQRTLGPGAPVTWIDNGVDPWPDVPPNGVVVPAPDDGAFAVAVIGAIGEPKGLTPLMNVAAALPPAIRVVVIGYTERLLTPGWLLPGRLWVHGVFEPAQLPALVARYGARLAFFPPGVPESYCYALSDAWLAGLPALVPDHGALGERVRRHGGGGVYAPDLDAQALAMRVEDALAAATPALAHAAARTLVSREGMMRAMERIYDELPGADGERAADEAALRRVAQAHLDARFFRPELLKLQGDLAAAMAEVERLRPIVAQREAEAQHLHAQLHRLEEERHGVHAEMQRLHDEALRLQDEALQARQPLLDAQRELERTRHDLAAWQARHQALVARLMRPLAWLPTTLRERIVGLGKRLLR